MVQRKKESDADDITLLPNPIHGAHVAPQRCTILRYGEKQIYDTKYSIVCQYSIRAVAPLNPGGAIAQFQRNDCSISPVEVIWRGGVRKVSIPPEIEHLDRTN